MCLIDKRMEREYGDSSFNEWTRKGALAKVDKLISDIKAKIDNTANELDSD